VVYYLNEEWRKEDGGELVIYNQNDNFLAKVAPIGNKMVVFMSENFPHEVLPTNTTRYSIAGWFRIDR
jgi:SM-20-related protein